MSDQPPHEFSGLRQHVKDWLALVAIALSIATGAKDCIADTAAKTEKILVSSSEMKLRLEATEARALDTANNVTALTTEVRAVAKEVSEVKEAVKASKKGRK